MLVYLIAEYKQTKLNFTVRERKIILLQKSNRTNSYRDRQEDCTGGDWDRLEPAACTA